MRLIGMLDSPYVRRVAIALRILDLPFDHESVSVFRQYDEFAAINPVVKAPTLLTDGGVVLMDSSLILDYLDRLVPLDRRLAPDAPDVHARHQRLVGLALAACEKSVQLAYEFNLRPADKQHQPWIDRVDGQLRTAYRLLEAEIGGGDVWLFGARPLQADIAVAVAWRFTQDMLVDRIPAAAHPTLQAFSARAEALPAFLACPPD